MLGGVNGLGGDFTIKSSRSEPHGESSPTSYFGSLHKSWATYTPPLVQRAVTVIQNVVNWLIDTRFGLAKIAGLFLVPAQMKDVIYPRPELFSCYDDWQILSKREERPLNTYYYNPNKYRSRKCVVFHNPNAMRVVDYFKNDHKTLRENTLPWTLYDTLKCPILFYDYRGVGINRAEGFWKCLPFATGQTIQEDAQSALKIAKSYGDKIISAGTSLGGAMAVLSADGHTQGVIGHDTFTSLVDVVMPNFPRLGHFLASLLNVELDVTAALNEEKRGDLPCIFMNNSSDTVIPEQARACLLKEGKRHIYSYIEEDKSEIIGRKVCQHGAFPVKMQNYLKETL